ncbi:hypothetical protein RRG08_066503 [Elysia crispata]|uniref:Uncharacterized protein n=1 Tax=Elysia crispata TaxID=231223 RepID=A0AAE0YII7_9GAST|nr:hypothetical protein RRG08_066503 [Elysia crispata]
MICDNFLSTVRNPGSMKMSFLHTPQPWWRQYRPVSLQGRSRASVTQPQWPSASPRQGSPSTVDQQSPACDGPITPRLDGSPYGRVQFPQLLITASSGRRALSASFIWRRLQL